MSWDVVAPRRIATGGWGDLYVGRRSDNNEPVVVKFLRDAGMEHLRRGFAREVRILQRGLPGLIPLLGADLNGPRPFYVMPYLPGGSLTQWAGRLNEAQVFAVAHTVAGALSGLHAEAIVHGDIKPDNVLVTQDGGVCVADPLGSGWGCTVLFAKNHGGTPGYWAPEVANGGAISKAGDVYSFGAMLYHVATGMKPVDRFEWKVRLYEVDLPPVIAQVILACTQEFPYNRPAMKHVVRMLRGESWPAIQQERAVGAVIGFVGVGLLVAAFGR